MLKRFLDYVEIRTKITSTFVFFMTISYLLLKDIAINWKLTCIFFAAMFIFDLTTTAINNYIDTKDNKEKLQFTRKVARNIIYVMFLISASLGLYLAFLTDIVIFLIGGLCFICGVFYTYGPVPISRQPLGEVLSGMFYGFMIPFIIMYINMPTGYFLSLNVNFKTISLIVHIEPFIRLLLLGIIPFCTTANIMLANNICDLEKDVLVKRHTLPYYIGKKAIPLFSGLYYLTYVSVLLMVIFKMLSPLSLLTFLTLPIVQKNINVFKRKQEKASTFIMAIKNYIIIMGINTVLILISSFL